MTFMPFILEGDSVRTWCQMYYRHDSGTSSQLGHLAVSESAHL